MRPQPEVVCLACLRANKCDLRTGASGKSWPRSPLSHWLVSEPAQLWRKVQINGAKGGPVLAQCCAFTRPPACLPARPPARPLACSPLGWRRTGEFPEGRRPGWAAPRTTSRLEAARRRRLSPSIALSWLLAPTKWAKWFHHNYCSTGGHLRPPADARPAVASASQAPVERKSGPPAGQPAS